MISTERNLTCESQSDSQARLRAASRLPPARDSELAELSRDSRRTQIEIQKLLKCYSARSLLHLPYRPIHPFTAISDTQSDPASAERSTSVQRKCWQDPHRSDLGRTEKAW